MSLKIVHINQEEAERERRATYLWEQVLKPKWERRDLEAARAKYPKAFPPDEEKKHA